MSVAAHGTEPARHLVNQQAELLDGGLHLPHGELDLGHRSGNCLRGLAGLSGLEHLIRPPQATIRAMVARSRSGLKGFTTQPVAPAALPSIFFSALASVVRTSSGTPR